jgi:hypothetical protein
LGKAADSQTRADTREYTSKLVRDVKKARKAVFAGFKVTGSRIEKILGDGSRIPINVSADALLSSIER